MKFSLLNGLEYGQMDSCVEEKPVRDVKVLAVGDYYHPMAEDETLSITGEMLDQMVANYKTDLSRNLQRPVDFNHGMKWAGSGGNDVESGAAAGWVLDLRHDGDYLVAKTEFNDDAADCIRGGKYKYASSVFEFDATDIQTREKVGSKFYGWTLTNQPHLQCLGPVILSEHKDGVLELKARVVEPKQNPAKAEPPVEMAGNEAKEKQTMELKEQLEGQIAELRLDLDKRDSTIVELRASMEKAESDAKAADEKAQKLIVELAEVRRCALEVEAKQAVSLKIHEGFVDPANKDAAIELYSANRDLFERTYSKPKTYMGEIGVKSEEPVELDYVSAADAVSKEEGISLNDALIKIAFDKEHKYHGKFVEHENRSRVSRYSRKLR